MSNNLPIPFGEIEIQQYELGYYYTLCCSTQHPEAYRPESMTLTAAQHAQNLFFRDNAQSLPTTETDVRSNLGWTNTSNPLFTPAHLARLFTDISAHGTSYPTMANDIHRVSIQFRNETENFVGWGKDVIQFGNAILRRNPTDPFTDADKRDKSNMIAFLSAAITDTERMIANAELVSANLLEFRNQTNDLNRRVDESLNAIAEVTHDQRVKELTEKITQIEQELARLRQERIQAMKRLFVRGVGGVIRMVVAATLYGIEISRLRRDINRLSGEKEELVRELERLAAAQAALERLDGLFFELSYSLFEVSTSMEYLQFSWNELHDFLNGANSQLAQINEGTSLAIVVRRIENAVNSWSSAGDIAGQIAHALNAGSNLHGELRRNGQTRVPLESTYLEPRFSSLLATSQLLNLGAST